MIGLIPLVDADIIGSWFLVRQIQWKGSIETLWIDVNRIGLVKEIRKIVDPDLGGTFKRRLIGEMKNAFRAPHGKRYGEIVYCFGSGESQSRFAMRNVLVANIDVSFVLKDGSAMAINLARANVVQRVVENSIVKVPREPFLVRLLLGANRGNDGGGSLFSGPNQGLRDGHLTRKGWPVHCSG